MKTLAGSGDTLWIGTKRGVFRHDGEGWSHVFGRDGKADVLRLWHRGGGRLVAAVKKLAPDDRPALIATDVTTAVVDGDKLEIQRPGAGKLAAHHPPPAQGTLRTFAGAAVPVGDAARGAALTGGPRHGAVLWAGFGLCVGVPLVFDLGLIPSGGDVATASSFAVNVALLAKPLGDIGKVYTKWRKVTPEAGTSGIAAERAERSRWRRPRKARRHDRLR